MVKCSSYILPKWIKKACLSRLLSPLYPSVNFLKKKLKRRMFLCSNIVIGMCVWFSEEWVRPVMKRDKQMLLHWGYWPDRWTHTHTHIHSSGVYVNAGLMCCVHDAVMTHGSQPVRWRLLWRIRPLLRNPGRLETPPYLSPSVSNPLPLFFFVSFVLHMFSLSFMFL